MGRAVALGRSVCHGTRASVKSFRYWIANCPRPTAPDHDCARAVVEEVGDTSHGAIGSNAGIGERSSLNRINAGKREEIPLRGDADKLCVPAVFYPSRL